MSFLPNGYAQKYVYHCSVYVRKDFGFFHNILSSFRQTTIVYTVRSRNPPRDCARFYNTSKNGSFQNNNTIYFFFFSILFRFWRVQYYNIITVKQFVHTRVCYNKILFYYANSQYIFIFFFSKILSSERGGTFFFLVPKQLPSSFILILYIVHLLSYRYQNYYIIYSSYDVIIILSVYT